MVKPTMWRVLSSLQLAVAVHPGVQRRIRDCSWHDRSCSWHCWECGGNSCDCSWCRRVPQCAAVTKVGAAAGVGVPAVLSGLLCGLLSHVAGAAVTVAGVAVIVAGVAVTVTAVAGGSGRSLGHCWCGGHRC